MEWVLILIASGGLAVPEIEHFPTEAACLYAVKQASEMEAWKDSLQWRCYNEADLPLPSANEENLP